MAIDAVPPHLWKKTPVVLKATAGLRLLSEEKAQALLLEVILRSLGAIVLLSLFHLSCFSPPVCLPSANFSYENWLIPWQSVKSVSFMLSYIVLKSFCFDVDRRHGETDLGYLFLSLLALLLEEEEFCLPHTPVLLSTAAKKKTFCHCQSRTRLFRPRHWIIISFFRWKKSLRNHHFLFQRTVLASWMVLMKVRFRRRKKWKQRGMGERARASKRKIIWMWEGEINGHLNWGKEEKVSSPTHRGLWVS